MCVCDKLQITVNGKISIGDISLCGAPPTRRLTTTGSALTDLTPPDALQMKIVYAFEFFGFVVRFERLAKRSASEKGEREGLKWGHQTSTWVYINRLATCSYQLSMPKQQPSLFTGNPNKAIPHDKGFSTSSDAL